MPTPAPNLDDRDFQSLLDDALRHVRARCPEWTATQPSDPGVTLLEAVATLVDQLIYRVNRVPELHERRLLELIGIAPFTARAARTEVTFLLSAPQRQPVRVPAGTQVTAVRTGDDRPPVFTTTREGVVLPIGLTHVVTAAGGQPRDRTAELTGGVGVAAFGDPAQPDDALCFGLDAPAADTALLLQLRFDTPGYGVDPNRPPIVWEASTDDGWRSCDVEVDGTGGLTRDGDVLLHVPAKHHERVIADRRASWVRARLVGHGPGYVNPPVIRACSAVAVGVTVTAEHADVMDAEPLGVAEGRPGQRFRLERGPVVAGSAVIEVDEGDGWQAWPEVATFADVDADRRAVRVEHDEVVFGPAIRQPDGSVRRHGAVPQRGAAVRAARYSVGGGRGGNVAAGMLTVLRDAIPFVSRVTNRRPAAGGVPAESVAEAAARAPVHLRTRGRAVTVEDYEVLTREAAPEVARVRCVPDDNGGVHVLVVPAVPPGVAPRLEDMRVDEGTFRRIADYLDRRRCIGARVTIEPARYAGVTVVAAIRAQPAADVELLQAAAIAALERYLDPLRGGPAGTGWPFGRAVGHGELFALLQPLPGVDTVDHLALHAADVVTGERSAAQDRVEVPRDGLLLSFGHQVRVVL
ncbi:putative baseplate assembly protein [Dactylosporangium sp. NPDC050588]|uniref:putative baseplate assembly protein n=1 Tax=Dactylosporangium sp. NPDC050588 TaxID=3157211 RepID=UPI0033E1DBDD